MKGIFEIKLQTISISSKSMLHKLPKRFESIDRKLKQQVKHRSKHSISIIENNGANIMFIKQPIRDISSKYTAVTGSVPINAEKEIIPVCAVICNIAGHFFELNLVSLGLITIIPSVAVMVSRKDTSVIEVESKTSSVNTANPREFSESLRREVKFERLYITNIKNERSTDCDSPTNKTIKANIIIVIIERFRADRPKCIQRKAINPLIIERCKPDTENICAIPHLENVVRRLLDIILVSPKTIPTNKGISVLLM